MESYLILHNRDNCYIADIAMQGGRSYERDREMLYEALMDGVELRAMVDRDEAVTRNRLLLGEGVMFEGAVERDIQRIFQEVVESQHSIRTDFFDVCDDLIRYDCF